MRYVRLGRSGLEVSRMGLDCHSLGVAQRERGWDPGSYDGQVFAIRTVHAALDAGINIFDTSSSACGTRGETLLGRALSEKKADVLLASFGPSTGSTVCRSFPRFATHCFSVVNAAWYCRYSFSSLLR